MTPRNLSQLAPAYTAPGQNARNAPMLNVLGMAVGVKLQHAQTGSQFSCIEVSPAPPADGATPACSPCLRRNHARTGRNCNTAVWRGGSRSACGGWHFRPRGVIHTFWNAHDSPAKFVDIYPSNQDFAHYLEELAQLGTDLHNEGANPFAPESLARFKALDARYQQEVFYEQMPEHMAKSLIRKSCVQFRQPISCGYPPTNQPLRTILCCSCPSSLR